MEQIDYHKLFHRSPLARLVVHKKDDQFFVTDVNQAARDYFKFDCDNCKNHPLSSFVDFANADHILQALNVCYQSKVSVSIQVLPKIPGKIVAQSFLLNPVLGENENVECVDMQARPPASDQAAIERERDDAISLFTSVFDMSEVGITVTDHHGKFVRVNDAFLRYSGWDRLDLIGNPLTVILPESDHDKAWERHKTVMNEKRKNFGESRILTKDGRLFDIMLTSVVLELSNGRSFRISTAVDVTELKRAKTDADEANRAKSAFLANMSHELRTPLNAIIGFSDMMINATLGPIENKNYVEYLGDIKFSAEHLLQIINDVLDMSKIEAGKMPLDDESIDLYGLIDSATRLMAARAQKNNVTIIQDIDPNLPKLRGDERLIRQIFLNILSNAIKFSNEGDSVDIKIELSKTSFDVIFKDEGIGIKETRIKEVMEPFGQIGDPRVNKGQGTGLGLPLAKAMMEMHGGQLSLNSLLGKGTKVTCHFPVDRIIQN